LPDKDISAIVPQPMERVRFRTGDGVSLEGEIRRPDGPVLATAVLCHPHPTQGGSKDHPLLWAIRNDLASRGFAVLGFNFRGVMGSGGSFGGGESELRDVAAALDLVRREADAPTFVAGWSFGAHVALRAAVEDERVAALALIGMPLAESSLTLPPLPGRDELARLDRPVLLLAGQADPFCPLPDLRALGRKLPRARVEVLSGTDHFLWKREREAARAVGGFAASNLLNGTEG
jgi:alpha/beta superfamily hydrolase